MIRSYSLQPFRHALITYSINMHAVNSKTLEETSWYNKHNNSPDEDYTFSTRKHLFFQWNFTWLDFHFLLHGTQWIMDTNSVTTCETISSVIYRWAFPTRIYAIIIIMLIIFVSGDIVTEIIHSFSTSMQKKSTTRQLCRQWPSYTNCIIILLFSW
jgi:hypothetical protein